MSYGHYYTGKVYTLNADKIIIDKAEYQASKWSFSVLVPFQKLKEKISNGLNLYELSEYFDVTVQYMYDCINFYISKYGYFMI